MTAPVFDAVGAGSYTSFGTGSSHTHTVSGSNTYLIATFQFNNLTASVLACDFNGTALTSVSSSNDGTQKLETWALINPGTGAHTFTWSLSGSGSTVVTADTVSYTGVNQTTPKGTLVTASGNSTAPAVTATSASGELVYSYFARRSANGVNTAGTGVTKRVESVSKYGCGGDQAGLASTSVSWTIDLSEGWTIQALPLKPVASAATAVTLSGPSSGAVNAASTNFTVGVDTTPITGTLVVTPTSSAGSGTFTPTTVSLTTGSPTATFTYTPTTSGPRNINCTNNGGLSNPANVLYTAKPAVSVSLVASPTVSTAQANLTGLQWAWFDNVTPGALVAPTDKGTTGTTDAGGVFTAALPNSGKTNAQVGYLIVSNTDGTLAQNPVAHAFAGPAAVT